MADGAELERVLQSATSLLEKLGIDYHVTGGLASSYYGEPRFTQDIDLVIQLRPALLSRLARELDAEFYFDLDRARGAMRPRGFFQALHRELLIKVDFHVGESVPQELSRSRTVSLFPTLEVPLVSKEDALVSKLLWVMEGSGKSRQDIVGMLLDPTPFDPELVEALCQELGCFDLWQEMLDAAERARRT